jgi:hypothetical protein
VKRWRRFLAWLAAALASDPAAAAGFEALAGPAAGPVELPTVVRLEDPPPPSLCVQHVTRRRDGSCSRACRQAEDVEPK